MNSDMIDFYKCDNCGKHEVGNQLYYQGDYLKGTDHKWFCDKCHTHTHWNVTKDEADEMDWYDRNTADEYKFEKRAKIKAEKKLPPAPRIDTSDVPEAVKHNLQNLFT